jgi:hypothetical protein
LVLCLMPAVYLVLLGPAVLELRNFFRTAKQPGGPLATPDIQSLAAPPPTPGPVAPQTPPRGTRVAPGAASMPPLRP